MDKRFEIHEEILKDTKECSKDFSCLSSEEKDICKIGKGINGEVYFLECKDAGSCNYKKTFKDCYLCSCPTRKEIYNKYGI